MEHLWENRITVSSRTIETPFLTDPPFYLEAFEKSYRYIIDEYEVAPREIAIFMPCAVRKPYSSSPSHQCIRMVISQVLKPERYHIVIFGTCGIVPAELERMYPYAHYKSTCWGNAKTNKSSKISSASKPIGSTSTSGKNPGYLHLPYRVCLGVFREALVQGSKKAGVPIDLILPPGYDQQNHRRGRMCIPGREFIDGRISRGVLRRTDQIPEYSCLSIKHTPVC